MKRSHKGLVEGKRDSAYKAVSVETSLALFQDQEVWQSTVNEQEGVDLRVGG